MTNSSHSACPIPPEGWACTRDRGHAGPCAAIPISTPRKSTLEKLREQRDRLKHKHENDIEALVEMFQMAQLRQEIRDLGEEPCA